MPNNRPDIVIIGSGMGGATLASALAPSGKSIVILERGHHLRDCAQSRDDLAIFKDGFFRPDETWLNGEGKSFIPGNYYNVGGNSKFYAAVLLRYRAEDFSNLRHMGGVSPAWPITYSTLEPWYQAAEEMYQVRGSLNEDPSEPPHSGTYPFPAIPDEGAIARLRQRLIRGGLSPSSLPLALDIEQWLRGGKTPWDAYPDTNGGKKDAETVGLAKALKFKNVSLITGARVTKLLTSEDRRISKILYVKDKKHYSLEADITVLSAGAVNSTALLLHSANENHPNGLANSSDMVGRHFMNHNCTALLAINPFEVNDAIYQKTLQFNDFYLKGGPEGLPLGNIQLLGKITANIIKSQSYMPMILARWAAKHALDWYVMSEDLPDPQSRVSLKDGQIVLDWKRSNWSTHRALVRKAGQVLRKAGYPIILSRAFDRRTPSHQCGTAKFGHDPKASVLNTYCRAHDHDNLFVMDASFLPTSAAVNPALTIAAQALRVGAHMKEVDFLT